MRPPRRPPRHRGLRGHRGHRVGIVLRVLRADALWLVLEPAQGVACVHARPFAALDLGPVVNDLADATGEIAAGLRDTAYPRDDPRTAPLDPVAQVLALIERRLRDLVRKEGTKKESKKPLLVRCERCPERSAFIYHGVRSQFQLFHIIVLP